VSINAEKPRKGSFVITVNGNEKPIVELLDLPRPFTKLRNLDLEATVTDIVNSV
jgi:hypothetical protein